MLFRSRAAESESEYLVEMFQSLVGVRHMPEEIRRVLGDVGVNVFDLF